MNRNRQADTTCTGWLTVTNTHTADGVKGSGGRAAIGSGGGGICWDKLAGLSWVPRRRTLAAATGRVVDDCDGDALLHTAHYTFVVVAAINIKYCPKPTTSTTVTFTYLITRGLCYIASREVKAMCCRPTQMGHCSVCECGQQHPTNHIVDTFFKNLKMIYNCFSE